MYTALKSYYTINASLLAARNTVSLIPVNIKLNILLSSENQLTPQLYEVLNSLEVEYIISLTASFFKDAGELAGLLPRLYMLIVLNRSSIGQNVLPVFADENPPELEKVRDYLDQQGICNIKFPIFNSSKSGIQSMDNCSLFLFPQLSNNMQNYFAAIPGYKYEKKNILIIASKEEITDLNSINDFVKQIVCGEKSDSLNDDLFQFYIERDEYESEKELWKKRILVYQDFLSLSKKVQEKEYYDTVNWYQQEYEVLPLWYKRLGHIIKVLTGKRRLGSLFSDKVKKDKA